MNHLEITRAERCFFFFSGGSYVSPKPSSSCTLILWTCRLVGMNSSFLSAFRLLALNEGPDVQRVKKIERIIVCDKKYKYLSCSLFFFLKKKPTLKPLWTLTSVVVEVCQCFLVREYYGLVLRDNLSPQVFPAGR